MVVEAALSSSASNVRLILRSEADWRPNVGRIWYWGLHDERGPVRSGMGHGTEAGARLAAMVALDELLRQAANR